MNPAGSRLLHALIACLNVGVLGSSDEPFAIASMVTLPEAPGSGDSLTPLLRMHLANFTDFRAWAAMLLPPVLPVLMLGGPVEPHALISATMAIRARAASGRRLLFMCSPVGSERVDISSALRRDRE